MDRTDDSLIPATPTPDDYAREAQAQEAFGVADDQGAVFGDDPIALFADWLRLAGRHEPNDPNAVALASVDADGMPDCRVVLLKDLSENEGRGAFSFYSNTQSAKGRELAANPRAALCFHWKTQRRQVRVRGRVVPVGPEASDAYFATRARGSRLSAWASRQSRPAADRAELVSAMQDAETRFDGGDVPRPPHWYGYRIVPEAIEFWQDGAFRLHDRILFTRRGEAWETTRLYP